MPASTLALREDTLDDLFEGQIVSATYENQFLKNKQREIVKYELLGLGTEAAVPTSNYITQLGELDVATQCNVATNAIAHVEKSWSRTLTGEDLFCFGIHGDLIGTQFPMSRYAVLVKEYIEETIDAFSGSSDEKATPVEDAKTALEELAHLKEGWDGHSAAPISLDSIEYAKQFIDRLNNRAAIFEPFPDPDGTVGLEAHMNDISVYLNFSATGTIAYVVKHADAVHRGHGVATNWR